MMKKYTFILFDWDGCLAQTLQIHLKAYKDTFAEYGIFPSDFEVTKKVFGDWNGPAHLGVKDVKTFTDKYLARVHKSFIDAPLYPHALSMVQTLSQSGKKLALVTTSTVQLIAPAIERVGMDQFFSVVLTAEDVTHHKPDAEIVNKALEKLDGKGEEAVIIGDSKSDLGAAQNVGIDSVLFYPPDHELFYPLE